MRDMTEQVKNAETPEEMRAEIYRLQHYDPMVRAVMDSANYRVASAEDRYTVLAYNALKQLADIKRHVLNDALMRPAPHVLVTPNAKVRGDAPLYGAASLSTDGLCDEDRT